MNFYTAIDKRREKGYNKRKKLMEIYCMKRPISFLLFLIMTLFAVMGMASCASDSTEECASHTDSDGDGLCDVCNESCEGESSGGENKEENKEETKNEISDKKKHELAEIVIEQLEYASSAKIEFSYNTKTYSADCPEFAGVSPDGEGRPEINAHYVITLSKEKHAVNLSVYAKVQERNTVGGSLKTRFDGMLMYIVDNVLYKRDMDREIYIQKEVDTLSSEELTEAVTDVLLGVSAPSEEETKDFKDKLKEIFDGTFKIEGKTATVSLDAKELTDYLNGINPAEKTVESVLDDALLEAGENSPKASDIKAKLIELLPLSLDEAVKSLDSWLSEEYGKTLAETHEKLVSDGDVMLIIENSLRLDGATEEEIAEIKSDLKTLSLYELIDKSIEEADGGLIFADYVYVKLSGVFGIDEAQRDLFREMSNEAKAEKVSSMLSELFAMTLSDSAELPCISERIKLPAGISLKSIDKLQGEIEITFIEGYNLSRVDAEMDYGYTLTQSEGKTAESEVYDFVYTGKATLKIYDLSVNTVPIVVDEAFK